MCIIVGCGFTEFFDDGFWKNDVVRVETERERIGIAIASDPETNQTGRLGNERRYSRPGDFIYVGFVQLLFQHSEVRSLFCAEE